MELIALMITLGLFGKWIFKDTANTNSLDAINLVLETEQDNPVSDEPVTINLIKSNVFNPTTFNEYIGQDKAKDILKQYISETKKRNIALPHILISGSAGKGKTTLVEVIANETRLKMVETITSEIEDGEQLFELIKQADGGIVFLDEIHALAREHAEKLYTLMERFQHNGQFVKPFTLIGATTELGEVIQNRKPFYERFKIQIELEDYSLRNLEAIGTQYNQRVFPTDIMPSSIITEIATNCRGTPRRLIKLLEATIFFQGNLKTVLHNLNIIKEGYTNKDLKILQYLRQNIKPIGLQTLTSYLDETAKNYQYEIEPYLLQKGLIIRGPRGRSITPLGISKMSELIGV